MRRKRLRRSTITREEPATSSSTPSAHSVPSVAPSPSAVQLLLEHFDIDSAWLRKAPPAGLDIEHQRRLQDAFTRSSAPDGGEDFQGKQKELLRFGLVVEVPQPPVSPSQPLSKPPSTLLSQSPSTPPPSPSTQPLSCYIAQFLNALLSSDHRNHPQHGFAFMSLPDIVRTRLFFHLLAHLLRTNIFLFSSQCKPHFFKGEGAISAIGLLHHVDSYHGTSEYLALTSARTLPHAPSTRVLAPPTESRSTTSLAVFRTSARKSSKKSNNETVTTGDCIHAFKEACSGRLQTMIESAVSKISKKRKLGPEEMEEALEAKRVALYEESTGQEKLPKGIKPQTIAVLRKESKVSESFDVGDLDKKLGDASATMGIWKSIVHDEFSDKWESAMEQPESEDNNDKHQKKELRTFTMTLNQLIHPDISEEDRQNVTELIHKAQTSVTDDINELHMLIHKTVLQIASGSFYKDTQWSTSSDALDIRDLLPEGFQLRDKTINPLINVAPIPEELQEDLKRSLKKKADGTVESDVAYLLSLQHIQILHSRLLGSGNQQSGGDKHLLWKHRADDLKGPTPLPKTPQGLSRTINEEMKQVATTVENLWSGSIYHKLVEYLIRILLRIHLAPRRENQTRQRHLTKAQPEKGKNPEKQMSRKSWLATFKRLANSLSDLLERGGDISKPFGLLVKHSSRRPPPGQQKDLPTIEQSLKPTKDASVNSDEVEQEEVDWELGETEEDLNFKEPSRTHLKALGSILISILESAEELSRDLIREKAYKGTKFTDEEVDIVISLARILRPFIAKKDSENDMAHVALRAPIAVIANTVLRATGYSKFTRRLSPSTSTSSLHSLGLGAVGLYESLCGKGEGRFDVKDVHGNPLSDVTKVTIPGNKRAVFRAFFDLEMVMRICGEYGLTFQDRFVYVDRYTVRVVGAVVPNGGLLHDGRRRVGYPVESQIEKRKKKKAGGGQAKRWTSEFFSQNLNATQVKRKAEQLSAQVEDLQKTIQEPRKNVKELQRAQTLSRRVVNRIKFPDRLQSNEYHQLQKQRDQVRQARVDLNIRETELRESRKMLYYYNKLDKADKNATSRMTSQVSTTTPTWSQHAVEDVTQNLDISALLADKSHEVVFSGTDYGLRKMSETVAVTKSQLNKHLNYYSVLADLNEDEPQSSSAPLQGVKHSVPRIPRSHTITAKQINEISHSNKAAKRRERRMKKPILGQKGAQEQVRNSMKAISEPSVSFSRAVNMEQIDTAHQTRTEHKPVLREFEHTNARLKDLQTQRLRTNRTWNKLGASERHYVEETGREHPESSSLSTVSPTDGYCSKCHIHHIPNSFDQQFEYSTQCPRQTNKALPVMMVGNAGTCVGSRIGGHARRGGKKLRHEHQQHCVVAVTDEYRTSKVCIYCFQEVRPARSRRIVNGKEKIVQVHGALECSNPSCPAFKEGYTIRPRDAQAAVAIALAGVSALTHPRKKPIAPFSREPATLDKYNTSRLELDQHKRSQHRTDAMGAPVQETGI